VLGWEPTISLEEGLARTYHWIEAKVVERLRLPHLTEGRKQVDLQEA
jgi:hypothetical protein